MSYIRKITVLLLTDAWLENCHEEAHLGVPRRAIGVPVASNVKGFDDVVNLLHVLLRQLDHPRVLLHSRCGCCAGDGNDGWQAGAVALAVNPADGELGWSAALFFGEALHLVDQLQVVVEGGLLEARECGDITKVLDFGDVLESAGEDLPFF